MVGLAEPRVCQRFEVCRAIVEELWLEAVDRHFPKSDEDLKKNLLYMDPEWQFPYAISDIDGCHLPIKGPNSEQELMKQYYNFKNFYLVVLLALVNAKYRFIWLLVLLEIPMIQPNFRVLHFGIKLIQIKFCHIKTM